MPFPWEVSPVGQKAKQDTSKTQVIWAELFREAFLTKEDLESVRPLQPSPPPPPRDESLRTTPATFVALCIFGLSVFLFICLLLHRPTDAITRQGLAPSSLHLLISSLLWKPFGVAAFALLIFTSLWAAITFFSETVRSLPLRAFGLVVLTVSIASALGSFGAASVGTDNLPEAGAVGNFLAQRLAQRGVGPLLSGMIFSAMAVLALIFVTDWFFLPSLQRVVRGEIGARTSTRRRAGLSVERAIASSSPDAADLFEAEAEIEVEATTAEEEGMEFREGLISSDEETSDDEDVSEPTLLTNRSLTHEEMEEIGRDLDTDREPVVAEEEEEEFEDEEEDDEEDVDVRVETATRATHELEAPDPMDEVDEPEDKPEDEEEDEEDDELDESEAQAEADDEKVVSEPRAPTLVEQTLLQAGGAAPGKQIPAPTPRPTPRDKQKDKVTGYVLFDLAGDDEDLERSETTDPGVEKVTPATTRGHEAPPPAPLTFRSKEDEETYHEAVTIILEEGRGSISLLQRRLDIGYPTASRLLEMMEAGGIVGPYRGPTPREVLMTPDRWSSQQEGARSSSP